MATRCSSSDPTALGFEVSARDASGAARRGTMTVARGARVETPAFFPVGTHATVKALDPEDLARLGAEGILCNGYHLMQRPGAETIDALGGIHRFMGYDGVVVTDSGGFQVMSLAELRTVDDVGVRFRSHLDGSPMALTPESAMEGQAAIGSDIRMPLDECPQQPATREATEVAMERTLAWARRTRDARRPGDAHVFGIVQGGAFPDLRVEAARRTVEIGFDGYAVGGVSVGESRALVHDMVEVTAAELPRDRPRYVMGVGTPDDLIECVHRGADFFDCVLPTRNARNGSAFVAGGKLSLRNGRFRADPDPIEAGCTCYACRVFSRAYVRHLLVTNEILGARLLTLHNVHHYLELMRRIRGALETGTFPELLSEHRSRRAAGAEDPE